MPKTFFESIIAYGGLAGNVFDLAAGPPNAGIITVLLSVGDGAVTGDIPLNLISTGALGSARTLAISGAEQNGRIFYLSVRNADIAVNSLTIVPTTSINGSVSLVVSAPTDYVFIHESSGVWRAYQQQFVAGSGGGGGSSQVGIIRPYTAGTSLLDAVYQKQDGSVAPASAISTSYMPCIGFVSVIDMPVSGMCIVMQEGDLAGFSGLIPGNIYIMSKNLGQIIWEGDINNIDYPTVSDFGTVVQQVAIASSATSININLDSEIIN